MANPGPDFLCVGMLKGGTRWLFDQLRYHPDFWMPPLKELHYFDRPARGINANWKLNRAEKARANSLSVGRSFEERDLAFLRELASHREGPLDLVKYSLLFRHKGALKSGDITPHYCSLEESLIGEITCHLPHLRVVLLVRDPVARAWSQICQVARRRMFDPRMLEHPTEFQAYLKQWEKMERLASASRAAQRWMRFTPEGQFRIFFMDDISDRPAETRAETLHFLGADPAKPSGELPPDHNPKASGKKLELRAEIRDILAQHFREELLACAKVFGGHAENWARRYGHC